MCGGLKGWPMMQRSACRQRTAMLEMRMPDELEARITSGGSARSSRSKSSTYLLALRRALLHELGARDRRDGMALEAKSIRRRAGDDPQPLEGRPRGADVVADECLAVRSRIARGHGYAARQEIRCPARADGAGADHRNMLRHLCPPQTRRKNASISRHASAGCS